LLLGIMLFNWFGYRLLIASMEENAKLKLEQQLDETNYDESELISIKVPASNLAYYTNSILFERIDGQIEIEGIQYKYVKRRLFQDSLELLCIPDQAAMRLQAARFNFFQLVNDLQHNCLGKKSGLNTISLEGFFADYYTLYNSLKLADSDQSLSPQLFDHPAAIPSCYLLTAEQPPENS
jgi:hypothetical protein